MIYSDDARARMWADFENMGPAEVRKRVAISAFEPAAERLAREWLRHKEAEAAEDAREETTQSAREASESARSARESANRSEAVALAANSAALAANSLASSAATKADDAAALARQNSNAARLNNRVATLALIAAIVAIAMSIISLLAGRRDLHSTPDRPVNTPSSPSALSPSLVKFRRRRRACEFSVRYALENIDGDAVRAISSGGRMASEWKLL